MESPQINSRKAILSGRSMSLKFMNESPTVSGKQLVRRNSLMRNSMTVSKYAAALDAFKNADDEEKDTWEDYRVRLKKQWTSSIYYQYYENFLILIGLLAAIEFIHATYYLDAHNLHYGQEPYLKTIELIFTSLFAFDWIVELILADRTIPYLFSFQSVVDILIIISNYYTIGKTVPRLHNVNPFKTGLLYAMFGFRCTFILRGLKLRVKFNRIPDAVNRYLAEIGLYASIMVLFFAAMMQFLESNSQNYPFHTWLYYIFVSMSSVGYGDISPETASGRVAAMCMIAFAIFSVPKVTNELIEKMNLQTVYMRAVYTPKSLNSKHIVICGDLSSTSLNDFFGELFHEDHENIDLNAVILLPTPPTVEMIFLMQNPKFTLSMYYLEGSALIDKDLRRAKAETAEAIFIMANKFSLNPDEEDSKSILLNLSIKRYLASLVSTKMLYCMQLLRPENRRHLANEQNLLPENDIVVCLNEIKMGVMAKALMYPGANTLLMNLVSSFSDDSLMIEEIPTEGLTEEDVDAIFSSLAWVQEYEKGCGWEIYTTPLSPQFEGAKFSELSWALYDKIGVVLFALQITDKVKGGSRLLLNPAHFLIPNQTEYSVDAFVIAKNKASSDLSFKSNPEMIGAHTLQVVNRNFHNFTHMLSSTVSTNSNDSDNRRRTHAPGGGSVRDLKVASPQSSIESNDEKGGKGGKKGKESKWKQLRRSALMDKKIKSSNHQEVMHRLEDEHLNKFYYVRQTPADIRNVIVKSNVLDEYPFINNHLIIIGKGLKNLYDLIRPLRAKHLGPLRYIVILYPFDIPPDIWLRIAMFDALLIVRGSPLEDTNLRRAGIFRAAQVVVMADGSADAANRHSGMEALIDSDAIFAYQHVRRMNPQTHVVLEIVNQSNIGYLEDENNQSLVNDPRFSPQFASGSLFTTDLLDSIVCQAYYNPDIIKVINKLISGIDQLDRGELLKRAAAEVGGGDSEDSEHTPPETSFRRERGYSKLLKVESSCLYQMSIPDHLPSKTYGALYQHLSQQGIIPLGLYRGVLPNINIGRKNNKLPYVFTNPSKDTELFSCDRVFVLSLKPEKINTKLDVKEWLLDLQMQKNKDKDKEKDKNKDKEGKGIESYEKHHKKLEEKIQRFTQDTTKKLGKITDIITKISDLKMQQYQQQQLLLQQQQQQQGYYANMFDPSYMSYGSPEMTSRGSPNEQLQQQDLGVQKVLRGEYHPDLNQSNSTGDNGNLHNNQYDSPNLSARRNSVGGTASPIGILKKGDSSANGNGAAVAAAAAARKRPSFSEAVIQQENLKEANGNGSNVAAKKRSSFSEPVVTQETLIQPIEGIPHESEAKDQSVESKSSVSDRRSSKDRVLESSNPEKSPAVSHEGSDDENEIQYENEETKEYRSPDQEGGELDERPNLSIKTKASPRYGDNKKSPIVLLKKRPISESKIIVNESAANRARTASAMSFLDQKVSGPKITSITRPQTAERIRQHRAQADEQFHLERAKRAGSPTYHAFSPNNSYRILDRPSSPEQKVEHKVNNWLSRSKSSDFQN